MPGSIIRRLGFPPSPPQVLNPASTQVSFFVPAPTKAGPVSSGLPFDAGSNEPVGVYPFFSEAGTSKNFDSQFNQAYAAGTEFFYGTKWGNPDDPTEAYASGGNRWQVITDAQAAGDGVPANPAGSGQMLRHRWYPGDTQGQGRPFWSDFSGATPDPVLFPNWAANGLPASGLRTVYVRQLWYWPSSWQDHPAGGKNIMINPVNPDAGIGGSGNRGDWILHPEGANAVSFTVERIASVGSTARWTASVPATVWPKGAWVDVEVLATAESAFGAGDASFRVWFDGVEITGWSQFSGTTADPSGFNQIASGGNGNFRKFEFFHFYGGSNTHTKTQDDRSYHGGTYISGSSSAYGAGANEPANFTTAVDWSPAVHFKDLESATVLGQTADAPWTYGAGWGDETETSAPYTGKCAIVADAGAPGGQAAEITWNDGQGAGFTAPAFLGNWRPRFGSWTELYLRWHMFFPSNYQHHPSNTTKIILYGGGNDTQASEFVPQIRPNGEFSIVNQDGQGATDNTLMNNRTGTPGPLPLGSWHEVEIHHVQPSSPAADDGWMKVWIDGVLLTAADYGAWDNNLYPDNYPNAQPQDPVWDWHGTENATFKGIQFGSYWGGSGGTKVGSDYMRWGGLYISGKA